MNMISLSEKTPAERQQWIAAMLTAEEMGEGFDDDFDIPPMPTPNTKPKHSVEVHESRKKCPFCEIVNWTYVFCGVVLVVWMVARFWS